MHEQWEAVDGAGGSMWVSGSGSHLLSFLLCFRSSEELCMLLKQRGSASASQSFVHHFPPLNACWSLPQNCAGPGTQGSVLHVDFGPCTYLQATGGTADTKIQPRKASTQQRGYCLHVSE